MWLWVFLLGVLASLSGALQLLMEALLAGEPDFHEYVKIPTWLAWLQLPTGLWVIYFSIRSLWRARKEPEPSVVIDLDEEAARAEEAMDAMYLREHGELPEKPRKDEK